MTQQTKSSCSSRRKLPTGQGRSLSIIRAKRGSISSRVTMYDAPTLRRAIADASRQAVSWWYAYFCSCRCLSCWSTPSLPNQRTSLTLKATGPSSSLFWACSYQWWLTSANGSTQWPSSPQNCPCASTSALCPVFGSPDILTSWKVLPIGACNRILKNWISSSWHLCTRHQSLPASSNCASPRCVSWRKTANGSSWLLSCTFQ